MLRHIYFLVSRTLQGECEGSTRQRQRLGFHDSIARSIAVPAAIPRAAKFATACAGILQS